MGGTRFWLLLRIRAILLPARMWLRQDADYEKLQLPTTIEPHQTRHRSVASSFLHRSTSRIDDADKRESAWPAALIWRPRMVSSCAKRDGDQHQGRRRCVATSARLGSSIRVRSG